MKNAETPLNIYKCPQAGQALTFFLQQKKVSKKCRRL